MWRQFLFTNIVPPIYRLTSAYAFRAGTQPLHVWAGGRVIATDSYWVSLIRSLDPVPPPAAGPNPSEATDSGLRASGIHNLYGRGHHSI
jgi:hypothetical protein